MRTILALDEMLAHAVMDKLPQDSSAETIGRFEMNELGDKGSEARLRALVLASPSVLAIGGRQWNALPMLKAMRLPYRVPVVVVAPEGRLWTLAGTAEALRVYSMVPTDRSVSGAGIVASIASECVDAWKWVHRRRKPSDLPRVPSAPPKPERGQLARVVPFRRPA